MGVGRYGYRWINDERIEIAHEIGYLEKQTLIELEEKCEIIGKMLGSLIKARS
jgi:hypothetical protein